MPGWLWLLVGSGGVIPTTGLLVRHRWNLNFYRDALNSHGIEGLDAASRATHPYAAALRQRRTAPKPRAVAPAPREPSGPSAARKDVPA